jgi:hypothetical protein
MRAKATRTTASTPIPTSTPTTDALPLEFAELRRRLNDLPAGRAAELLPLCNRLGEWARLQQRLVQAAQDALDQQRVDMQYLHFDVEATRRERDAFRAQLQQAFDEMGEL